MAMQSPREYTNMGEPKIPDAPLIEPEPEPELTEDELRRLAEQRASLDARNVSRTSLKIPSPRNVKAGIQIPT